jgi:hypothetical protein
MISSDTNRGAGVAVGAGWVATLAVGLGTAVVVCVAVGIAVAEAEGVSTGGGVTAGIPKVPHRWHSSDSWTMILAPLLSRVLT